MPRKKTWEREADAWAALYLLYDDNEEHMCQTFWNQNFNKKSAEEIHEECVKLAKFLDGMGSDAGTDGNDELKGYFEEARTR